MGINTNIPFRSYVANLFIGVLLYIFGCAGLAIMFIYYLKNWKDYWAVYIALIFLGVFGYYKMIKGMSEWKKFEQLEIERMELENEKLKLEIKKLKK